MYTCDYKIPNDLKGEIIIGWYSGAANCLSSDTLSSKYGIMAYAYADPTGNGLGAYMLGTEGDGKGFLLNYLQFDGLVVSSPIWVETTGDAGLKYNDAALYYIDDVRGFAGKTDDNTLQVANMVRVASERPVLEGRFIEAGKFTVPKKGTGFLKL